MPYTLINHLTLHYEEVGEGVPIVFLSGLTQEVRSWRLQVNFFSARGFRVVTYDTRGQGGSDKPDDPEAYAFSRHVDDLYGLLDHLQIDRAHLVGLSHGGAVAQWAALRSPERVSALVLADTMAYVTPIFCKIFLGLIHATESGGNPLRFDVALPWLFSDRFIEANAPLLDTLRDLSKDQPKDPILHLLRASLAHDLRDRVGKIVAPTLVMCGALDLLTPLSAARYLHRQIKGSDLVILPECGHVSSIEAPEPFNREVLKFFLKIFPRL
jgi:3-oxoadipate enol-lactonase